MKNLHKNLFHVGAQVQTNESRLVWQNAPTDVPTPVPPTMSAPEPKKEIHDKNEQIGPFADINKYVGALGKHEAEESLDEKIELNDIVGDSEKEMGLIERLSKTWTDTMDKLDAYLSAMFGRGVSHEEADGATRHETVEKEIEEQKDEKEHPQGTVKLRTTRDVKARNVKRAEHAASVLAKPENRKWNDYLNHSSAKWGFPPSTLAAFIEMESAWKPEDEATYLDKNSGKKVHAGSKTILSKGEQEARGLKLTSSARGLAQWMGYDWESYQKSGRYEKFLEERKSNGSTDPLPSPSDPNLANLLPYIPEVAIDYVGFHLHEKISHVNRMVDNPMGISAKVRKNLAIDQNSFKPEYKLDEKSDVADLYLAYNSGELGYLVYRRYHDGVDTDKNHMVWFQRRDYQVNGETKVEGDVRAQHGVRVAEVAAAFQDPVSNQPK